MDSPDLSQLSERLELATRCALLAGGGTYFAGLVVVNLHLQRYGVNVLGFFAQQYVTAGMWVAFPAAVGLLLATYELEGNERIWTSADGLKARLAQSAFSF